MKNGARMDGGRGSNSRSSDSSRSRSSRSSRSSGSIILVLFTTSVSAAVTFHAFRQLALQVPSVDVKIHMQEKRMRSLSSVGVHLRQPVAGVLGADVVDESSSQRRQRHCERKVRTQPESCKVHSPADVGVVDLVKPFRLAHVG